MMKTKNGRIAVALTLSLVTVAAGESHQNTLGQKDQQALSYSIGNVRLLWEDVVPVENRSGAPPAGSALEQQIVRLPENAPAAPQPVRLDGKALETAANLALREQGIPASFADLTPESRQGVKEMLEYELNQLSPVEQSRALRKIRVLSYKEPVGNSPASVEPYNSPYPTGSSFQPSKGPSSLIFTLPRGSTGGG